MGNVVQSDLKGVQLFLNELQKGEDNFRNAMRDAAAAKQQVFNNEVTAKQLGMAIDADPITGQTHLRNRTQGELTEEQAVNQFLQQQQFDFQQGLGRQEAFGEQKLQGELANTPEAKALRELNAQLKKEERGAAREEGVEDIKAETIGKAEAAVDPKVVEAKRQAEIDKLLIQTSPEAVEARNTLFTERLKQNEIEFAQKLTQNTQLDTVQKEQRMREFQEATNTVKQFSGSTLDTVQGSRALEEIFGFPAGTINPVTAQEQLNLLGEASAAKQNEKAIAQSNVTAFLEPTIKAELEAIDFEIDDFTDKRDLALLTNKNINAIIQRVADSQSVNPKQVGQAMVAMFSTKIQEAITDIAAGEVFDTDETEEKSLKQLRFFRDRLKQIAKSGL